MKDKKDNKDIKKKDEFDETVKKMDPYKLKTDKDALLHKRPANSIRPEPGSPKVSTNTNW